MASWIHVRLRDGTVLAKQLMVTAPHRYRMKSCDEVAAFRATPLEPGLTESEEQPCGDSVTLWVRDRSSGASRPPSRAPGVLEKVTEALTGLIGVIVPQDRAKGACEPPRGSGGPDRGFVGVSVCDEDGEAVPGVTVTLSGNGRDQIEITDARGLGRFPGLEPGSYSLSAELEGFSSVRLEDLLVRGGSGTGIPLTLYSAIEERIAVTSERPLLDERRIELGTTLSSIELEKIPTARDPWSVLNQTPGVAVDRVNVGGNESGQQANFNAPGVLGDENTFLVDGVEITDMAAVGASSTYFDFEQFTEMQSSTGGDDIYKAGGGVALNLVTKRGTNEFRGSMRLLRVDDDFFDVLSQQVPVLEARDDDLGPGQGLFIGNSIDQITDYGVEAGGPVLRDKLWFWGSFGVNDIKNLTGGDSAAQIQSDDTILENTAFKVNAQITGSNSALGSWNNGDKKKSGHGASPTRPRPTTWDQRGSSAVVRFEDSHVFTSNFFLTGTYGKVDGGFSLTSRGVVAAGGDPAAAVETVWDENGIWQNSWIGGSSSHPSEEWKLDGSYFFDTGSVSHELKFGTRFRDLETASPFHWPGRDIFHIQGENFGIGGDTEIFVAHRGENPLVAQSSTSLYAQDTLGIGDFTVNVGFRYDLQEGRNEPFSVPGNPGVPDLLPALSFQGADAPFDWETITPRIGATYAVGAERKTQLRASYSQFPEQLQADDISRSNPLGDAYAYHFFTDVNGDGLWNGPQEPFERFAALGFDPDDPGSQSSPHRTNPGLDPEITHEVLLAVEHAFFPELVVGATYTWRSTVDKKETRDLIELAGIVRPATAADYELQGNLSGTLPDGSPYRAPFFDFGPGRSFSGGSLLLNGDRSVDYSGLGVYLTKRLSNRWMARGYVQLGEAEWDIPGDYFSNSDPTDGVGGFDNDGDLFAEQAAGSGAKAGGFAQSSWQYNLTGLYQVAPDRPWGFNVSANIFGREGHPLPYFHRVTTSQGNKSVQVTNRLDSFRMDDILTVDLRLEKEFAATGNVGFTVSADVFNLFDESYVLRRELQLSSPRGRFVSETLSPRIWRLGVRVKWR